MTERGSEREERERGSEREEREERRKRLKNNATADGQKVFCGQCESMPCIAILISTSKTPCSFLLLLILSLQQN
jgi:hypothetical protein